MKYYILKIVFAAIVIIIVASAASAQETPTPSEIIDTRAVCIIHDSTRMNDAYAYKYEGRSGYTLSETHYTSLYWRFGSCNKRYFPIMPNGSVSATVIITNQPKE